MHKTISCVGGDGVRHRDCALRNDLRSADSHGRIVVDNIVAMMV